MVNGTDQIKSNLWIYIGIIPLCDTLKVKGMIFIIKRGACESDRQYCAELHLSVVFSLEIIVVTCNVFLMRKQFWLVMLILFFNRPISEVMVLDADNLPDHDLVSH